MQAARHRPGRAACELLFDRLQVAQGSGPQDTLLVTGAAGGVGSALLQLARALTGLTVVGTASRAETRNWALEMGAHHVVSHAVADHTVGSLGAINATNLRRAHALMESGRGVGKVVLAGFNSGPA